MTDWRLQGQEKYLRDVVLARKGYQSYRPGWDHDHCEFCWAKFSQSEPDALREGYATSDHYRWVCATCHEDFRQLMGWPAP